MNYSTLQVKHYSPRFPSQCRLSMESSSIVVSSIILGVLLITTFGHQAEARAFFVFGDSLVDSGNNNYLATTARADAPPYGIDYPTRRPTGRFSNGLNIPDLISQFYTFILYIYIQMFYFFGPMEVYLYNCLNFEVTLVELYYKVRQSGPCPHCHT